MVQTNPNNGWHGQLVCLCTGGQAASGTPQKLFWEIGSYGMPTFRMTMPVTALTPAALSTSAIRAFFP